MLLEESNQQPGKNADVMHRLKTATTAVESEVLRQHDNTIARITIRFVQIQGLERQHVELRAIVSHAKDRDSALRYSRRHRSVRVSECLTWRTTDLDGLSREMQERQSRLLEMESEKHG